MVAVDRWRALLAVRRGTRLSLTEQMSLFAELTVLDLVTRGGALPAAWWRGPRREPHDIVTPARAFEVKAVGRTSSTVTIHGVDQLEPPGRPLALVLVEVVEAEDGRSLPDLVDGVLSRVDDLGDALWSLTAAGFDRAEPEHYPERFTVEDIGHLEVTDEVPRIVASSFGPTGAPTGLSRLQYRLDLDVLHPFVVRGEGALRGWAAGS